MAKNQFRLFEPHSAHSSIDSRPDGSRMTGLPQNQVRQPGPGEIQLIDDQIHVRCDSPDAWFDFHLTVIQILLQSPSLRSR